MLSYNLWRVFLFSVFLSHRSYGVLLWQPSGPYRVAARPTITRRRRRSGRSRLQHWIKHPVATQATTEHVESLEFDEPALDLSNGSLGNSLEESESKSIESTAEILMVDNSDHRVPRATRSLKTMTQVHPTPTPTAASRDTSRMCLKLSLGSNYTSSVAGMTIS